MINFIQPVNEYIAERKAWDKRHEAVNKKNEKLIKQWRSIPWWKFWEHKPFEEKREIIMSNWRSL